jgi:hypothetical protein
MNDNPADRERALEAIEACRPAHDDMAEAELAWLAQEVADDPACKAAYRQIQRLDRRIGEAFADVEVPRGLEGRLLETLATAEAQRTAEAPPQDSSASEPWVAAPGKLAAVRPVPVASPAAKRRISRRWAVAGALAATAAAGLLIAVGWQLSRPVDYSAADLHALAIEHFTNQQHEPGHLLSEVRPPADYPPSPEVHVSPRSRWRRVEGLFGHRAVAYDLFVGRGRRATLYVVRSGVNDELPGAPPSRPALRTGGCSTAAWAEGPRLYVLVVAGDRAAYQRLLNLPRGPLT